MLEICNRKRAACQGSNLISFAAMARIQNDISASVVEASFVTSDFTRFAEHPVLLRRIVEHMLDIFLMNTQMSMKRNLFG